MADVVDLNEFKKKNKIFSKKEIGLHNFSNDLAQTIRNGLKDGMTTLEIAFVIAHSLGSLVVINEKDMQKEILNHILQIVTEVRNNGLLVKPKE